MFQLLPLPKVPRFVAISQKHPSNHLDYSHFHCNKIWLRALIWADKHGEYIDTKIKSEKFQNQKALVKQSKLSIRGMCPSVQVLIPGAPKKKKGEIIPTAKYEEGP